MINLSSAVIGQATSAIVMSSGRISLTVAVPAISVRKLSRRAVNLSFFYLLFVVLLQGCETANNLKIEEAKHAASLTIAGYTIPQLKTPAMQLAFATSIGEEDNKKAALQAVQQFYPEERDICGMAAFELAYLLLGRDYRLTSNNARFEKAMKELEKLAQDFSDIPAIKVLSLWYQGWIASELLHDKERALPYFREVAFASDSPPITQYTPERLVDLTPGQPAENRHAAVEKLDWSDLALLAIVQTSENTEELLAAIKTLSQKNHKGLALGLALKSYLKSHQVTTEILPLVTAYIATDSAHEFLRGDLQLAVTNLYNGNSEGGLAP